MLGHFAHSTLARTAHRSMQWDQRHDGPFWGKGEFLDPRYGAATAPSASPFSPGSVERHIESTTKTFICTRGPFLRSWPSMLVQPVHHPAIGDSRGLNDGPGGSQVQARDVLSNGADRQLQPPCCQSTCITPCPALLTCFPILHCKRRGAGKNCVLFSLSTREMPTS